MAEDGDKGNGKKRRFAEVFSDLPVTGSEGLAFGFEGLARTLAELAQNPRNRTPFTAVVRGDWGRGKTTLMLQVERLLGEATEEPGVRRVRTLWFNAWKYPSEETVLAGLLGALLDQLRRGDLVEQLKLSIDERKDRLAKRVLKLAAPWLEDLVEEGGRYSEAEDQRAFYDAFRRLFAEACYLWQHGAAAFQDTGHRRVEEELRKRADGHALAIFLDDLDRCRESRVLEVLEAINLFLDLPGVCFYLGLDWKRLSELLTNSMPGREEQFLEKIVQISVDLSEVSESGVLDYAAGLVKGSSLAHLLRPGEEGGAMEVLAGVLKSNHPRHVKRVLNDLAMTLAILRNAGHLGDDGGKVPEKAVLAWHLLHEALPPAEWESVRGLRANLEGFLRLWEALGEPIVQPGTQWISDELRRLFETGRLSAPVDDLADLTGEQLDLLVHYGSPPREGPSAADSAHRPDDLTRLDGSAWVSLPGGTFQMGAADIDDAHPVHPVTLSPFKIARFPVTNAQYRLFCKDTGRRTRWILTDELTAGKEKHPAAGVSWRDAEAFCAWLSRRMARDEGGIVRLPTEAEWEFVAGGWEGHTYPWGNEEPNADHANFGQIVDGTTPVGAYPKGANSAGVCDLAGNVWEWCADWYGPYREAHEQNPRGPAMGELRVLRGGAYDADAEVLRAARRSFGHPEGDNRRVGFRVVWSPSQKPE